MTTPRIRPTTRPGRDDIRRRPPVKVPTERREEDNETISKLDALLDEIDSILEDNPIETLRRFVQKPGQ